MRQTRLAVFVGAIAALGAVPSAQAQTKVALGKPDAESAESFTLVSGIRELPSGKVLVVDRSD